MALWWVVFVVADLLMTLWVRDVAFKRGFRRGFEHALARARVVRVMPTGRIVAVCPRCGFKEDVPC